MKFKVLLLAAMFSVSFAAYYVYAYVYADHLIDQKSNKFNKKHLKIKVGDNVKFRNSDPYAHNVFSLSDAKPFDLGSYPQGQSKKINFDKEGLVEVECSIHPMMQMTIEVSK